MRKPRVTFRKITVYDPDGDGKDGRLAMVDGEFIGLWVWGRGWGLAAGVGPLSCCMTFGYQTLNEIADFIADEVVYYERHGRPKHWDEEAAKMRPAREDA